MSEAERGCILRYISFNIKRTQYGIWDGGFNVFGDGSSHGVHRDVQIIGYCSGDAPSKIAKISVDLALQMAVLSRNRRREQFVQNQ